MPIDITGEFQPSDGVHGFDLYDPQDIKAGNINVALTLAAGGKFDANGVTGEIVVQNGAGVPSHSATEGTPYWDTTNDDLYVNNDGSTAWTKFAGGAIAAHAMLDGSVHTDSVADAVTRGSIIYGNATPKWDELVIGAANTVLQSDGTDAAWGSIATAFIDDEAVTYAKMQHVSA